MYTPNNLKRIFFITTTVEDRTCQANDSLTGSTPVCTSKLPRWLCISLLYFGHVRIYRRSSINNRLKHIQMLWKTAFKESREHIHFQYTCHVWYAIHTHYHNSNLIRLTVTRRVDEVILSDHPRRVASRMIQWYGLIHETWYCTPDQVTIMMICLLYAFFLTFFSDFKTSFGL